MFKGLLIVLGVWSLFAIALVLLWALFLECIVWIDRAIGWLARRKVTAQIEQYFASTKDEDDGNDLHW